MVRYGFFIFKGNTINLHHLADKLNRSTNHPNLLLSSLAVDQVGLLVEAGLIPPYQLKMLRVLASTGFHLGGSVALKVRKLADYIEHLAENS